MVRKKSHHIKRKAQHQSTTNQNPLENDPIYLDSLLFEGESGFIAPPPKPFAPSCDSFLPLIHADYNYIVSTNRHFGKFISQSCYAYYNIMHLWARLFAIMRHRCQLTWEEEQFVSLLKHDRFPVTNPIDRYLKCLGDFMDTIGEMHEVKVPRPNRTGDFGRISAENHNIYESLPAPRFALERISKDIEFTKKKVDTPIWEIQSLRPVVASTVEKQLTETLATSLASNVVNSVYPEESRILPPIPSTTNHVPEKTKKDTSVQSGRDMPTVNLLGWYPAQELSPNQLMPLENLTAGGGFIIQYPQLLYCSGLMNHVADNMNTLQNYKTVSAMHEWSMGSCFQEAFLDIKMMPSFNRCQYYSDGLSRASCLSYLDTRLATGMVIMGLRIKKNEINNSHPWACYDFGQYADVPANWIANRNNVFVRGMELQSYAQFHTVVSDREQLRANFLRNAMFKTNST